MSSHSGGARRAGAPSTSARVRQAVTAAREAEARIVHLDHERVYSYAVEPSTVSFIRDGTPEGVSHTAEEERNMRGAVVTHNHPLPRSFSNADVALAYRAQVRQIRAVTPHYVYIMEPPHGGWNLNLWNYGDTMPRLARSSPMARFGRNAGHGDIFHTISTRITREYAHRVATGRMTRAQAENAVPHAVWTRFARATGVRYRRVRRAA